MKKARFVLLVLPIIGGALYLRSLASWRPKQVFIPETGQGNVIDLKFAGDGKTLFLTVGRGPAHITGENSFMTSLWALEAGAGFKLRWQWTNTTPVNRRFQLTANDAHIFLDGELELLDANTGQSLANFRRRATASVSGDEQWLVSSGGFKRSKSGKHGVSLYKTPFQGQSSPQGEGTPDLPPVKVLRAPSEHPVLFSFSPAGEQLVLATSDDQGGHLDIYDVNTGKRIATWTDWQYPSSLPPLPPNYHRVYPAYESLQWSANGRFLLSRGYYMNGKVDLSLWRTSDGQRLDSSLLTKGSASSFQHYEVQNDGRLLSWGIGNFLYLSDGPTLRAQPKLLCRSIKAGIITASLSPDGSYVAIALTDAGIYTHRLK